MAIYSNITSFMKQGDGWTDPADDPFISEVDLSRPSVNVDTELDSPAVEARRNLTIALSKISQERRAEMGYSMINMLQECTWDGKKCGHRYVQLSLLHIMFCPL